MEAIFVAEGRNIDYTPASAVVAGEVVMVGSIPMVATRPIAASALGALACGGVFDFLKDGSAFTAGDAVYWNTTGTPVGGAATGAATSTASGAYLAGVALADAAEAATTVRVMLTAAMRTTTIAGTCTADALTGSDSSLGISGKAGAAGGAGGAVPIAGGAGHTNGNGGAASLAGGAGAGTGTGGAASVVGGASAGATGTAGAASIDAGAATGGTGAAVNVGTTNATAVNIAKASVPTAIVGPLNRTAGASTAAAGSTYEDAGALPAGTAGVYPTTAADDTKGVIVNAADKVAGRMLFIGNGVSNKILKVYGPEGAAINGAAANAAFSSVSGKGVIMYCLSADDNTWLAW